MFSSVFSSLNVPPCLSRKPKRAESEIPSLPEAGPAVLSFERQHGKINGHLLREPLGHTVLQPHGQTALGPVVCCCCWVSLHCLLWEDFKPCAAIKISVFSLFVYLFSPLSSFWSLSLTAFPPKLQLCDKHHSPLLSITLQKKKTPVSLLFASLCVTVVVDVTLSSANIYPDESAGRISALLCLYFLPRSTMVTSQTVPR